MTKDEIFEVYYQLINDARDRQREAEKPHQEALDRLHEEYIEAFCAAAKWAESEEADA